MKTPAERAADKTDKLIREAMESKVVEHVPWKLLVRLCELQLGRPFVKLPVSWADVEEVDCRNLDHLLGSTHFRPVSWEKP